MAKVLGRPGVVAATEEGGRASPLTRVLRLIS